MPQLRRYDGTLSDIGLAFLRKEYNHIHQIFDKL
jgi:hypothetical protein